MTRRALVIWFTSVMLVMLYVTVTASLGEGVFAAAGRLWADAWFRATLADAYFGFLAVYVWIAWRERALAARLIWLVLLLALGNIAIAGYFLWALSRLEPGDGIDGLFRRAS
jgi:Protein of unknown function (DUF1475)